MTRLKYGAMGISQDYVEERTPAYSEAMYDIQKYLAAWYNRVFDLKFKLKSSWKKKKYVVFIKIETN